MMSLEAVPPPEPPDEPSAAPCIDDDTVCPAGFEWLYQDYWPPLLRFVRQAVRRGGLSEARLDTEGVVQETGSGVPADKLVQRRISPGG